MEKVVFEYESGLSTVTSAGHCMHPVQDLVVELKLMAEHDVFRWDATAAQAKAHSVELSLLLRICLELQNQVVLEIKADSL